MPQKKKKKRFLSVFLPLALSSFHFCGLFQTDELSAGHTLHTQFPQLHLALDTRSSLKMKALFGALTHATHFTSLFLCLPSICCRLSSPSWLLMVLIYGEERPWCPQRRSPGPWCVFVLERWRKKTEPPPACCRVTKQQ